jgi:hypothetical protein
MAISSLARHVPGQQACALYIDLRAPLFTPFNGQPPICDGLFKKNLHDTSLKLNHVALAMRFRFASFRLVLFEFGSFQRLIEVPLCPVD